MAHYVLEILDGDRAGEILPVAERALRIGRKPTNDVVLADEKTSGVHAEVVPEGDRHVLRDLGSTNGTFLDGKRVTEVVLTPGDVVTIGRLRVKFRDAAESGAAASSGEFAMHRLDAGRVQKRGGAVALLGLLVVVGAGVGGWFWWQGQHKGEGGGEVATLTKKPVLAVPGNRLAAEIGGCEGETGWDLRAAGRGFAVVGGGSTGSSALEAARDGDGDDFAVARLAEALPVFPGRSMQLKAFVRTQGAAQVGVRCVLKSANEANPLRFRHGTPLQQAPGWQPIEVAVHVPAGCDRLQVELVAVLPDAESSARIDDVAVVEGGDATALEHAMAEGGQKVLGTGSAVAIKSFDAENPVTLYEVVPGAPPAPLRGLADAGFLALSDLGAALICAPAERSVQIAVKGVSALEFVFPADSAGQLALQAAPAGEFEATAGEFKASPVALLLGNRATRVQMVLANPAPCTGRVGGGVYRLQVEAAAVDLVLGFRAEGSKARELLGRAHAADGEGRPGEALDVLRELQRTVPQDSEVLAQAGQLRTQIMGRQADAVQQLRDDLAENRIFDTRGGYERVVQGLDELAALYGAQNLENADAQRELRAQAAARLAELDGTRIEAARQRLERLAGAFAAAEQQGLAGLLQGYLARTKN